MSQTAIAILWMTGSIVSFSTMAVAARELDGQYDTMEIMFYRSIVGFLVVCFLAGVTGTWRQIKTTDMGLHTMRNLAHFTGQNLWFYALTLIPLAQLFAIEFTSPLWVILLSPLVLGERLTLVRAVSALIGFCGILIVARPDIAGVNVGILTAAGAAFFFAFSIMFTKRLTRTQSITCIIFYMTLMQLIFGAIAAGFDGDIAPLSMVGLPYLALIAVCGVFAHYCLTNALSLAPATVVVPIDFIRLPVIAIVGMLLYQEALDIWVFVGALIIFGANYMNIWVETRKKSA